MMTLIQEAVQRAMIVFHRHIPEEVDTNDVILKYNLSDLGASPVWTGLVAAQESGETWRLLVSKGSLDPEIGVFIPMHQTDHPEEITTGDFGPNEPRPSMCIHASLSEKTWTANRKLTTPRTYKVCKKLNWQPIRSLK